MLIVLQCTFFPAFSQESSLIRNRVEVNLMAILAENLVVGYEYSFSKNGLWLGLEHHLNGLSETRNRQLNSLAAEYRYYPFVMAKPASGFFAGAYMKYRWGEERSTSGNALQHDYQAVFSGVSTGYRFTYSRLALSAFLGYGLALGVRESTDPPVTEHTLNDNYRRDPRLGITVGLGF